jgi:DinB superfamily
MDAQTLLAILDFSRARLMGSLDAVEKSGEDARQALIWRPAANRAHIAWQALHCAAVHDKYLHVLLLGRTDVQDPQLVERYGGGSIPSDAGIPSLAEIRATLQKTYTPLREFVASLTPADLEMEVGPAERRRKLGDAIVLLGWHEGHHQGQLHLTWNLYKQAMGIV